MANISVRNETPRKSTQLATNEPTLWDPFRMMRDFFGMDPFREMTPYVSQLPAGFTPSFEVKETKDAYVFRADVPGVKESEIDVTLTSNRLTISGKREAEHQEKTDTYYAYERSFGSFARSFTLPEAIDASAVQADLKDGVLTISVPKTPEAQPKKIAVQTQSKKS